MVAKKVKCAKAWTFTVRLCCVSYVFRQITGFVEEKEKNPCVILKIMNNDLKRCCNAI